MRRLIIWKHINIAPYDLKAVLSAILIIRKSLCLTFGAQDWCPEFVDQIRASSNIYEILFLVPVKRMVALTVIRLVNCVCEKGLLYLLQLQMAEIRLKQWRWCSGRTMLSWQIFFVNNKSCILWSHHRRFCVFDDEDVSDTEMMTAPDCASALRS